MKSTKSTHGGPRSRKSRFIAGGLVLLVSALGIAALTPAPLEPTRIHNEILIARSPQDVFDFVTTPGNWPKWHPSSLGVEGAIDHPLQVGEEVIEDFLVAGRRGQALWKVEERAAPRVWRIEGGGKEGGHASIQYTLEAMGSGTLFRRDMSYRMPNLLTALLDPLLTRSKISRESTTAVSNLKAVLEETRQR